MIQFDICDCCNRETLCEVEPGGVDEHGPWWFTTCIDFEDCEDHWETNDYEGQWRPGP